MANSNGYPFLTQKDIATRLAADFTFRLQCLDILVARQTSDEVEEKSTKYTNKRGLRCSEAAWMPELARKLAVGEEVTSEEYDRLAGILPVYRKQLAAHFRAEAIAANPELAEKGKVFGL